MITNSKELPPQAFESLPRTLPAYYFYLVLGFCVSVFLVGFISFNRDFILKLPDWFDWLNTPKYYDPELPIKYLASIVPDILFATSIFVAGTLTIGYLTTVFFSRKSINWKQITLRAYSHGTLCAVLFLSIFLLTDYSERPILVTFGILCYAVFACASPFLLLLLAKKQINNQQVEPKRTNKVISYTLTVIFALLLVLTYKLLIEMNYIKYLYPSYDVAHENEQKMKEMIRYFDFLVLSPLLIFLFVKTATLITFRLQSVCNYLNKRNVALIYYAAMILPAVIIGLTGIINIAFSSEKLEVIKSVIMMSVPALVFPLLLHFLAQRNHFPKLPKLFRLY